MNLNYSSVDNAISSRSTVDTLGKRTTQYVNADGNYYLSAYSGYWKQIKKWNLNIGVNMNVNLSRNTNFINGLKNINDNKSGSVGLHLNHDKEKSTPFH